MYLKFKNFFLNPNHLTISRILSAPLIIIFMLYPNRLFSFLAAMVFSLAAITDYFDGYLARKNKQITNFGKLMDPIADKIIVSFAFIMLVEAQRVPAWVVCIIMGRELAVTSLRNVLVKKDKEVAASNLGKYKMGFQIATIIPLLLYFPFLGLESHKIGYFFLPLALIFTIWSGVDYFLKFKKLYNDI